MNGEARLALDRWFADEELALRRGLERLAEEETDPERLATLKEQHEQALARLHAEYDAAL